MPIYRRSFELALCIQQVVHGFSRHHKYGLGVRLQHGAQGIIEDVIRAQNSTGEPRSRELETLRVEVEVLKNLLHLAKEVKAFKSFNAYARAADLAVDVGRQTEGWFRQSVSLRAPESRPTNPEGGRS